MVTYQGYNLQYEVKNSSGQVVSLINYSFIASDTKGYKVTVKVKETGETFSYSLKTKDLTAPIVKYIRDYRNALVNEPVELVYPSYHDLVDTKESLSVNSVLYYGEDIVEEVTPNENTSFTPDKVGKYFLKTTVSDSQGNSTMVTYTYNVVDDPEYANKVFYFDEAEGVNCIKDKIAGSVVYNTESAFCYGTEKGSTKIMLNHDGNTHVNPRFALNYPLIDLTGYSEIYFWVYNASAFRLGFFFNMTSAHIEIYPGQWTKFSIPVSILVDLYTTNGNQFDLHDITGLQIFFHSIETNEQILDGACVYLSAVYAR